MWGVCIHIHTHVIEYYQIFHLIFWISKKDNPIMTAWMDLEGIMLSEKNSDKVSAPSCPTLCNPMNPTRLLYPWDSPGKNTGVGCHFLLQGIFPTQGSNPGLPHCRQTLYRLSHQGKKPDKERQIYNLNIWIKKKTKNKTPNSQQAHRHREEIGGF